jgi:small-conductance mechanosensitive channel
MFEDMNHFLLYAKKLFEYPLVRLGSTDLTLKGLVLVAVWMTLIVVIDRTMRRIVVERILRRTHLEPSLQFAISRIIGYCLVVLGGYIALQAAGIDLSSLAIVAGAVGVGIGFGLQNIINNFVSGLIILAERPVALGHRVEVAGVAGIVTQIKLRSTVVVTNDNISIIVPNSEFIARPVTNWSHGDPKVRLRLAIGVAYGSDVEKLARLMVEVAAAHPATLKDPPPKLFFVGFGQSSLDFELGVWTATMSARPIQYRSDLFYAIERSLRQNHIEIPFPQRDLHIRSGTLKIDQDPQGPPSGPSARM